MQTNRIINPFNGEVVSESPYMTREEALASLSQADAASREWRCLSLQQRVERVRAGISVFEKEKESIAGDITLAVGKPIAQSVGEMEAAVAKMHELCELAPDALAPEEHKGEGDITYKVMRVPKGVIDIIAPWNYPVFTALNGVLPALLAGNAVTLKEESTPAVGGLYERAFGSFEDTEGNSVDGLLTHLRVDIATSNWLATNCDLIKHRVFTGSVRGGREVSALLGERAKNTELTSPFISVSLELGGCDAAYVHDDADLDAATGFIISIGRLHNTGQSCCATKRTFVHSAVLDAFVAQATSIMAEQKLGDPLDPDTTIGPLYAGREGCDRLFDMVVDAQSKGARVIVEARDVTDAPDLKKKVVKQINQGWFFTPTLLLDTTPEMVVMQEEAFGPLLPIAATDGTLDALMENITANKYGLTCSVWTNDPNISQTFVDRADTGTVYVNWCNDVHTRIVWEGLKNSGNGAGALSSEGFRVMTNTKSVLTGPDSA